LTGLQRVELFAVRFRQEDGFISAYCASFFRGSSALRVLKERGYEGGDAIVYYGLPSSWAEGVEEEIIEAVG
jgi:neutral ceramidase